LTCFLLGLLSIDIPITPMLNPNLPISRKLPNAHWIHTEIMMDNTQKRTRAMMNKAAELARIALELEKDHRLEEALAAYSEVCSHFKRIIEVADSKDVSDVLFVLTQQNLEPSPTARYPSPEVSANPNNPGTAPQDAEAQDDSTLLKSVPATPRLGRLRSDSFTNLPTFSPQTSMRRPSLAPPNLSLAKPLKKSSGLNSLSPERNLRPELKIDSGEPVAWSRFSRRIRSNPDETTSENRRCFYPTQPDPLSSRNEAGMPHRLKEKQEPRRPLDLNSIPETEESFQSLAAQKAGNTSSIGPKPLTRLKPRLTHNPSMPNLSRSARIPESATKGHASDKGYSALGDFYTPNWRDSRYISSSWGFDEILLFYSSPSNATSLSLSSTEPTSAPDLELGSSLDNSAQCHAIGEAPSPARFLTDDKAQPPGTDFMNRTGIVFKGLQLSIQTDDICRFNEQPSPATGSPQSPILTPCRNNQTLFQIIGREEIQSKPAWKPPPSIGLLRPLWHLACIRDTITVGGFLGSKRNFIHPHIWRQPGIRIPGSEVKLQALAYLHDYLCRLREHWVDDVLGVRQGLEDLEALTLNTHHALASKLSFIPPLKRSQNSATTALFSFANRISKSVERFQANYVKDKVEDNSAYLDWLVKFIDSCKFLGLVRPIRQQSHYRPRLYPLLARIQRFLEFINSVILAFIQQDLHMCLAKYLKRTRELAIE
ncbi:hypothetical protein L0F63_000410, partial [Massospora cicadina]